MLWSLAYVGLFWYAPQTHCHVKVPNTSISSRDTEVYVYMYECIYVCIGHLLGRECYLALGKGQILLDGQTSVDWEQVPSILPWKEGGK